MKQNEKNVSLCSIKSLGMKKINWGTGIVIAFALFISFILYFVVKVQTNNEYDNELVVEEYYKHDANFNEEFNKLQNAKNLAEKPVIVTSAEGITVTFPASYDASKVKGKISLYRPSAKKLDFEVPISLSGPMLIPNSDLAGGRWDITIAWSDGNKEYLQKQTVYLTL